MKLKVIHRAGARYRGTTYAPGETFEVDPAEHNVAAEIRYLTKLKRVEEVGADAPARPRGRVGETKPATRTRSPRKRGGYQTRDLRAED